MQKKRSKKRKKLCLFCGEQFAPRPSKYHSIKFCSFDCYRNSFGSSVKKCLYCGMEYKIKKSAAHKSSYCSTSCMANGYRQRFIGPNNPNYKNSGMKICLVCGAEYKTYDKRRKFCSLKCSIMFRQVPCKKCGKLVSKSRGICGTCKPAKAKREKKKCKKCSSPVQSRGLVYCDQCSFARKRYSTRCVVCEKTFETTPAEAKKYCSIDCYNTTKHGLGNPNYRHGQKKLTKMIRDCEKSKKIKKTILARDKYTCQKCGQVGGALHIDHIMQFNIIFDNFLKKEEPEKDKYKLFEKSLSYEEFWNKRNLRVLCKKCNLSRPKR